MRRRRETRRSKVIAVAVGGATLMLVVFAFLKSVVGHPGRDSRTRAQVKATGLLQAIEGFHSTYNTLPRVATKSGELITEGKDATELLSVLLGKEEAGGDMQNRKQIRFLNVEETKQRENEVGGPAPKALYDSWGNPFRVRFASEEPWEIQDPFKPGEVIRGKAAIVFSYGKNGKPGDRDDVKTW